MEQGAERSLETLALMLDRLAGAANLLEQTVSRLEEQHLTMSGLTLPSECVPHKRWG